MIWTYRVVRHRGHGYEWYRIIEAHYDEPNGTVIGYCDASPGGDTLAEMREDLDLMRDALRNPALDEDDLP